MAGIARPKALRRLGAVSIEMVSHAGRSYTRNDGRATIIHTPSFSPCAKFHISVLSFSCVSSRFPCFTWFGVYARSRLLILNRLSRD